LAKISLVYGTALGKGLRALSQHSTSAKSMQECQT